MTEVDEMVRFVGAPISVAPTGELVVALLLDPAVVLTGVLKPIVPPSRFFPTFNAGSETAEICDVSSIKANVALVILIKPQRNSSLRRRIERRISFDTALR